MRSHKVVILLIGALLTCFQGVAWAQFPSPSKSPEAFLREPPKPLSIKGPFSLVAIGDLLYSHPMATSPDAEFQKVVELIKRGDVAIGNQEGVFFDFKSFKGTGYGHGLLWGEGALAKDMKAMGLKMLSVANNHSTDFGAEGLLETIRLLDEAGIVHAGGGRTLREARKAGILQTPNGRVALVAASSTFKPNAGANDSVQVPSRTGISTLRTRKVNLVTADQMALIRKLATELASPRQPAPAADATEVPFGEQLYRVADKNGLRYDMDLYDHAGLLKAVRDAKQESDLVVFTVHAHESPTGLDDDTPEPPDFLIKLSHDAVDAGADVVMNGGPHSLRGVEIYKGRPVLYGMGLFFLNAQIKILQETMFRKFPDADGQSPASARQGTPPSWYDGMVATIDFDGGKCKSVRLHPLDLGKTRERQRGVPHLADADGARRILEALQKDSAKFGTKIEIEGSVGVIRMP